MAVFPLDISYPTGGYSMPTFALVHAECRVDRTGALRLTSFLFIHEIDYCLITLLLPYHTLVVPQITRRFQNTKSSQDLTLA
jgi:hypothetical protein